ELLVEVLSPRLQCTQAAPRGVQLLLGAAELEHLAVLVHPELAGLRPLLAGLPGDLLELLPLHGFEAVLRPERRRDPEGEADGEHRGERAGEGAAPPHGPTARSTRASASCAASQASATVAPKNATVHVHGR